MQTAASTFRHSVKFTKFPSSGERVVLVIGRRGIALEPTTAYTMVHQRSRGLSPNTMMPQMRSVAMLLDWVDDHGIDLEQRLGSGDLLTNSEIYSLKEHLRDRLDGNGVVAGGQFRNRCVSVREYNAWHAGMVISRIPNKDWQRAQEYRSGIERFVALMSTGLPSPAERNREGHSEDIQEIFLEAIQPGSPNNPFKQKFQLRNYALLMLFHELGVRRAEPMKVMGEDLHLYGDRPFVDFTFRNDDIVDPRPLEGPLSELEMNALLMGLNAAAHSNSMPISERAALWLSVALGANPMQMALLREEDLKRFGDNNGNVVFQIDVPRHKKGDVGARDNFRRRPLTAEIAGVVLDLIAQNAVERALWPSNSPVEVRPLFHRLKPRKAAVDGPMRNYSMHVTSQDFSTLVSSAVTRLGVISHRTGAPLKVTSRRLRYTFATRLVKEGTSKREVADLHRHAQWKARGYTVRAKHGVVRAPLAGTSMVVDSMHIGEKATAAIVHHLATIRRVSVEECRGTQQN